MPPAGRSCCGGAGVGTAGPSQPLGSTSRRGWASRASPTAPLLRRLPSRIVPCLCFSGQSEGVPAGSSAESPSLSVRLLHRTRLPVDGRGYGAVWGPHGRRQVARAGFPTTGPANAATWLSWRRPGLSAATPRTLGGGSLRAGISRSLTSPSRTRGVGRRPGRGDGLQSPFGPWAFAGDVRQPRQSRAAGGGGQRGLGVPSVCSALSHSPGHFARLRVPGCRALTPHVEHEAPPSAWAPSRGPVLRPSPGDSMKSSVWGSPPPAPPPQPLQMLFSDSTSHTSGA